jgi:hypothetical protein
MITRETVVGKNKVLVLIITAFDIEPVGRVWGATRKQHASINAAGVPTYTVKSNTYDQNKARVVYPKGIGFDHDKYATVVNCLLDK